MECVSTNLDHQELADKAKESEKARVVSRPPAAAPRNDGYDKEKEEEEDEEEGGLYGSHEHAEVHFGDSAELESTEGDGPWESKPSAIISSSNSASDMDTNTLTVPAPAVGLKQLPAEQQALELEIEQEREIETGPPPYDITSRDADREKGQGSKTVVLANRHVDLEGLGTASEREERRRGVCFHDVCYEVAQWKRFKSHKTLILQNASGRMIPGVNAIMGPTGSGKTTLLDILAGRKPKKAGLSGTVLVDGRLQPTNFRFISGYVVQDDVVLGTLSVCENLSFSAALRLPSHTSRRERRERVERVIRELGLEACANTKVGNEFIRGISGGERKRTSIGMELIIEPQVLFLDEPTTGLDANTAVTVTQLLRKLSREGNRVVIMSIHQPRYAIFKLFDTLTLLSKGQLAYHGPAKASLGYFERLGFVCEEHENPADYFLDVLTSLEGEQGKGGGEGGGGEGGGEREAGEGGRGEGGGGEGEGERVSLVQKYLVSEERRATRDELDSILKEVENGGGRDLERLWAAECFSESYATRFYWQFLVLSFRSSINLIRNPATSVIQFIMMMFFAVVIGLIYFQLGLSPLGFTDRLGVFYFIVIYETFVTFSAIGLFIEGRPLFLHEHASGYYRVSAFFLSKILTDIISLSLIPNIIFSFITYLAIGLRLEADKFFIYFLFIHLTNLSASAVVFAISAAVKVADVVNILVGMLIIASMLFSGLLIALESLPFWITWMEYLSFIRYAIEGLALNEINGLIFNGTNSSGVCVQNPCIIVGSEQLTQLGYEVGWLWYDVAGLIVFITIFLLLAYFILRIVKK